MHRSLKKLFRECPVCGSGEGEVLTRVELAPVEGEALPPDFDVCLCSRCQLCFDDLDAAQADFDAYYRSSGKYAHANTGGSGGSAEADLKRWQKVIEALAPWIPKESRIVDVGCGKGGLLAALRAHGYRRVAGIEPSGGCREHLASQNIAAYGSVGECLDKEQPFDGVVCSQVLEHVYSLGAFLNDLRRLLSPEGTLYVEVPDAAGYAEKFHAPFYYFDREHINHFTRASLNNLFLTKLGFQPVYNEAFSAFSVDKFQTPNVLAVYRKGCGLAQVLPDEGGASKIRQYVEKSEERDAYPQLRLLNDDARLRDAPVLLWGYGAQLRRLLRKGVFQDLKIQGIIDRNKGGTGEQLLGWPILSPEVISEPLFRKATVVITTVLYAGQIEKALRSQSFEGRIIRLSD